MSNKQNENLIEEMQEQLDELQWGKNVSDDFIKDVRERIPIILDFVERWNKQDKEADVAEAARFLSEYFEKTPINNTLTYQ
jgi:hypothetical protein